MSRRCSTRSTRPRSPRLRAPRIPPCSPPRSPRPRGDRARSTRRSPRGLYGAVHTAGYHRKASPAQQVEQPEQLTVTFTNAAGTALPPDAAGWSAQAALPQFSPSRADPFLPVWMTWAVRLDPLARGTGGTYAPGTLGDKFVLDADQADLTYPVPASFTTGQTVDYTGAIVLSKKPFGSLTEQIDRYIADFPYDAAVPELTKARADFASRNVMSQALDTFNLAQTLRTTIPQIAVADLVTPPTGSRTRFAPPPRRRATTGTTPASTR